MKKVLLFVTPVVVAVGVFLLYTLVFSKDTGQGTIQVTSIPKSSIYLNNKLIGKTPFPTSDTPPLFPAGDYTIRLVPDDTSFGPFEAKITITKAALTVVDRTFGVGATSEGSIIGLTPLVEDKDAEILITSFPDKAQVSLDNDLVGQTPLLLRNVTESDHEIKVSRDGYKDKVIPVRPKTGYKLSATVFLGINLDVNATPTPTPFQSATPAAQLAPSVTATAVHVLILSTPNGFLNVRDSASITGSIVGQIHPGETYPFVEAVDGWDHIILPNGKDGWISNQYAQKQ